MFILVLNSGSSTLKLDLLDVGSGGEVVQVAQGVVDRVGSAEAMLSVEVGEAKREQRVVGRGYGAALVEALDVLRAMWQGEIGAVGHRVVHGGDRFVGPTLLTGEVLESLEELSELAPLHNPPALEVIKAARGAMGQEIPMVAVFDTAFHSTLPQVAYAYALPHEIASRHKIRRYGFHGIAHQYMLERYCAISGTEREQARIITLQLGNGCSVCAIRGGKSIDTSMGFTPLEGLVMGTRSGDLDAGVVGYIAEKEGITAEDVVTMLNKKSGLLGVSNSTADMRSLLEARQSDELANLAIELFCYRVRKYIGAYMSVLGGADALVFGGGIGEHAAYVRARILDGMEWCGVRLDGGRSEKATGNEAVISEDGSAVTVCVVPVEESILIAKQTFELLEGPSKRG